MKVFQVNMPIIVFEVMKVFQVNMPETEMQAFRKFNE